MPTKQTSRPPGRVPDGIVAAVLACAVAAAACRGFEAYVAQLAARRLALVTMGDVPFKYQTLTLQRAALASGHVLLVYGSSELFCCGRPFRPSDVFASGPTGFEVLAVGHAGTGDLYFAQTFAALADQLRGRRVIVSDSPSWFSDGGPSPARYGSNFSPEAAYAFVFAARLPLAVRELGARRMLAFPETLRDDPLLGRAVGDLADPTPLHLAEYAALRPLGRLAAWALGVRDAARTAAFLWRQPPRRGDPPPSPAGLDWVDMAERGTRIASTGSTTNPFGIEDRTYRELRNRPKVRAAAALYDAGRSNRDGGVLPVPRRWRRAVSRSTEWTDLRLALHVLRAVGARPLVWTMPLAGTFYDYTAISAPVRRTFYDRWERTSAQAGVPSLDFRAHDEDRYFVADPGSHLSARGWVFADRAADVFWHTGSIDDVRSALTSLARDVPPPAPPRAVADAADARAVAAAD